MRLRRVQKHGHCFYWIICSTGIFKKVNLALLTYQNNARVQSVNCTTYLWHVPKLRQYLCLRVFIITIYWKCDSSWLEFFTFFCLVSKLFKSGLYKWYKSWILFQTFRDMWTVLKYYKIFVLPYTVKLISTGSHFFSYVLLLNKLCELNFFKLQNIIQTCPAA